MSEKIPDDMIDGLIRRAIVPKGFRPRSSAELEKAQEALGDDPTADSVVDHVLESILDDTLPLERCETLEFISTDEQQVEESSDELVEMFRSGGDIPPDIAKRLLELENEAGKEFSGDDGEEKEDDE